VHGLLIAALALTTPANNALTPADREVLARAERAYEMVEPERAWKHLEPLVKAHPKKLQVQKLACAVRAMLGRGEPDTLKQCAVAVRLARKVFLAPLELAQLLTDAGDKAGALAELRQAGRSMKTDPMTQWSNWQELARRFMAINAVSFAQLAMSRVPQARVDGHLKRWIEATRRNRCLPLDRRRSGIAATEEPIYIEAHEAIVDHIHAERHPQALKAVDALARRYPKAAGPLLLRCELKMRSGAAGRGIKDCRAAIARYDEAVEAHVLLGQYALQRGKHTDAVTHLERASALAPDRTFIDRLLMEAKAKLRPRRAPK